MIDPIEYRVTQLMRSSGGVSAMTAFIKNLLADPKSAQQVLTATVIAEHEQAVARLETSKATLEADLAELRTAGAVHVVP